MQIQQHKALLSPETKWMEGEKIWEFTFYHSDIHVLGHTIIFFLSLWLMANKRQDGFYYISGFSWFWWTFEELPFRGLVWFEGQATGPHQCKLSGNFSKANHWTFRRDRTELMVQKGNGLATFPKSLNPHFFNFHVEGKFVMLKKFDSQFLGILINPPPLL